MTLTMAKLDCQHGDAVVQEIKRDARTDCFRSLRENSMGELSTVCLWQQFRRRNCHDSRNMLIERYANLVSITAARLFCPVPFGLERDDLLGAGAIGLVKAVDRFDPERNIKFETYAITLIRGAILDMLRGDDWVPRLVRDQQKQLRQANTKLEAYYGRPATEDEIASEIGIAPEKLDQLLSDIGRTTILSLDDRRIRSDQRWYSDRLTADADNPLDCVALRDQYRALASAIDRLPDRERSIVSLYYYKSLTFKQISAVHKVTEPRVFQLHAQAVRRMRGYLQSQQDLFPRSVVLQRQDHGAADI
jgi:RNA polymerase sigma factor for flagellar operon FliA